MADIKEALRQAAIEIRDEHKLGANTAKRVGGMLLSLIDWAGNISNSDADFSDLKSKVDTFLEGSDTDGIINKWKELETFLSGQTQSNTLADLLSVKADKSTVTELQTTLNKKLDIAFFKRLFGVLDADDNELSGNDMTTVIDSLKLKVGAWTEEYLSVKGQKDGSGSGTGGSTSLGGLNNVGSWADEIPTVDRIMVQLAGDTHWSSKSLSDIVGLDTTALQTYLDNHSYATQDWVTGRGYLTSSALNGYATQSWVTNQGYATQSALNAVSSKVDNFLEGTDTDGIINKWKELETFLFGQTQSSTLADLLAVKADKSTVTDLQSAVNSKLDIAYFKRVFGVLDANDNELSGNDMTTVIASLKLKVGTWTEEYFSIKGKNPGTGGSVSLSLSQLADVSLSSPGNGESLVYSAGLGKWVNGAAGLSKVTVKLGNVSYDSVDGTVNLPAYPTSLPASDVYNWAKQSSKPGYVWDEIGSKPDAFTPSAHTHSSISDSVSSFWLSSGDAYFSWGHQFYTRHVTGINPNNNGTSSGSCDLYLNYGNTVGQIKLGSTGEHYISTDGSYYSGTSRHSQYLDSISSDYNLKGFIGVASWYDWGHTSAFGAYFHGISMGSPDGGIACDIAYSYSNDVLGYNPYRSGWSGFRTLLDTSNYAFFTDSRYLLQGSSIQASNNNSWLYFNNNVGGVGGIMGDNDFWRIYGRSTASNSGYLEIATADDAAEPIYVRQYSGLFESLYRTLTLLDESGNTTIPNNLTVNGYGYLSAQHLLINGVTWNSNWNWSGQGGQPTWLWGSNDGTNMYVYNPSNFSVNYASSAGNADTLDGVHNGNVTANYLNVGTQQYIDLSSWDSNTWYPCVLYNPPHNNSPIRISFTNNLSSNVPSWATHSSGFTFDCSFEFMGSGWGTTESYLRMFTYHERFVNGAICYGLYINSDRSFVALYLRGGGNYSYRTSNGASFTPYSSTVNLGDSTYPANVGPTTSRINNVWEQEANSRFGSSHRSTYADAFSSSRSLWGQFFRGDGDVNGTLTINADYAFTLYGSSESTIHFILSGQDAYIGQGAWATGASSITLGNNSNGGKYAQFNPNGLYLHQGWLRTYGSTGLYNESYGGGIYQEDNTWVRVYGGKSFHCANEIYAGVGIWTDGYLSGKGQNTSDGRLKTDIQKFNGTEIIKSLSPKSFRWNDKAKSLAAVFNTDEIQYGLIAQETKKVAPWLVVDDMFHDGYMGVRYEKLIPVMLACQIEHLSRTEILEQKVAQLEKENNELKRRLYA